MVLTSITASGTVVNSDGWQIVKEGGLADFTIVNQKGKLQVNAGGTASKRRLSTVWQILKFLRE